MGLAVPTFHLLVVTLGSNYRAFLLSMKDTPDVATAKFRASEALLEKDAGSLCPLPPGWAGGSCPRRQGACRTHWPTQMCLHLRAVQELGSQSLQEPPEAISPREVQEVGLPPAPRPWFS